MRLDDIDRLAALGIRRCASRCCGSAPRRRPRAAPTGTGRRAARAPARARRRADRRACVHHGSGPRYTLAGSAASRKLAAYAARGSANAIPWVDAYTPVNEPLTTARFQRALRPVVSASRDDAAFVRASSTSAGIVLAMRAIRAVNPRCAAGADRRPGLPPSTPRLRYQAKFENERRWLTFDLLCGRVAPRHRCGAYLRMRRAEPEELTGFAEAPVSRTSSASTPTSPASASSTTAWIAIRPHARRQPAGIATPTSRRVRVHGAPIGGFEARLREAGERYGCRSR